MNFKYKLSPILESKAVKFREFANGAAQATLLLRDGTEIHECLISMSQYIVAIWGGDDLPCNVADIVDIYQKDIDVKSPHRSGWRYWDKW